MVQTWEPVRVSGDENAAYCFSTYNAPDQVPVSDRKKIVILGGGPTRIGQGIEFDTCCVHAAAAVREAGYESVMVNCNPGAVSTDYDASDKLYIAPLTVEDVLAVCEKEKPEGVIVQFGGRTPLDIARELSEAGVRILGTAPDTIGLAEDRDRFRRSCRDSASRCRSRARQAAGARRMPSPHGSATPSWYGPPAFTGDGAWRSCTTTACSNDTWRPRWSSPRSGP